MNRHVTGSRFIYLLTFIFLIGSVLLCDETYAQGRGKGKGHAHAKKQKARIKNNRIKKEDQEDENGNRKTSKSYDTRGNKISETFHKPDGSVERWTQFSYDADDDLTETLLFDSTDTEVSRTSFAYDNKKRLGRSTTRRQDGSVAFTGDFGYDDDDNMTELHVKDSVERTMQRGHYTYAGNGRISEARGFGPGDSLTSITTYATDDSGNVTEQILREPGGGRLQRVTFEYDNRGNITRMVVYDASDSVTSETFNEYDNKDNITRARGRIPSLDMEHTVETDYDNEENPIEERTYNKHGELVDMKRYRYEKHP